MHDCCIQRTKAGGRVRGLLDVHESARLGREIAGLGKWLESVDLRWDTSRVRLDERFSYFVEGICRAFTHLDPELFDPESAFFARIHHREAGGSAVTHLTSSRYISRRLPASIARSPDHNFYLNFIASGTIHGRQAGQDETVSQGDCQRRLKIRPKGGAKDCHLGWWSDLGVRLGVGDAVRGFFGGSGQRSHAELKRSAPAGRPQGGMVYRIGVGLATRALGARCRPGPSDGVPQFSYRHCFCGRGFG